jgi:hypothetical protein
MKKILFTLLFLNIHFISFSQEIWKKGWCITQVGDTLHGSILFQDWATSPKEILFRDTINNSQQTYEADDITRLAIYNNSNVELFEGKRASFKKYYLTPIKLGQDPISNVDTVSVFLELIFESEVIKLYRFLGDGMETRFYLQKESSFVELDYAKLQVIDNTKIYRKDIERYRFQLKAMLSECPTINFNGVEYTEKSLIKLLKEYHNYCKVDYDVLFENRVYGKFNFGFSVELIDVISKNNGASGFNVSFRYLLPKKFNNRFIFMEVGRLSIKNLNDIIDQSKFTSFGIYTGTYFGKNDFQPFGYVGFSNVFGLGDFGFGMSYTKRINISVHSSLRGIGNGVIGYSVHIFPIFKKS